MAVAGGAHDFRSISPRFNGDNLAHNLALVEVLRGIAAEQQVTVAQLAIAWVLAQGADIVPLVGARRRDRLAEALGAAPVHLSADEPARIVQAFPAGAAAGERYPSVMLAHMDSEQHQ